MSSIYNPLKNTYQIGGKRENALLKFHALQLPPSWHHLHETWNMFKIRPNRWVFCVSLLFLFAPICRIKLVYVCFKNITFLYVFETRSSKWVVYYFQFGMTINSNDSWIKKQTNKIIWMYKIRTDQVDDPYILILKLRFLEARSLICSWFPFKLELKSII